MAEPSRTTKGPCLAGLCLLRCGRGILPFKGVVLSPFLEIFTPTRAHTGVCDLRAGEFNQSLLWDFIELVTIFPLLFAQGYFQFEGSD